MYPYLCDFFVLKGSVLTSKEIPMEPLFPSEGGHLRRVSAEWS